MADAPTVASGRSPETRIRRDAEGRWYDGDEAIDQPRIERAFDRWLRRGPDGRYILENDVSWGYVAIEGAPLFVRRIDLDEEGATLELSDGRVERLDPHTLRQGPEGALYCTSSGAGGWPARFDRATLGVLFERIGEDARGIYVIIGRERYYPPASDDPLGRAGR